MSAGKHTPGPWMVFPSIEAGQFVILTENGVRKDIARTYGFDGDPREANARLIAAAPDLLEALSLLLLETEDDPRVSAQVKRSARAALAKAQGAAS